MAKNMQPIAKRCRALGLSPAVMGYSKKTSNRNPGGKMRRKKSEYSMQLTEKQKVKFIYGILEKRLGLAATRREARQLVNHAHFTVNGKKVNIPSYIVKVGDVIEVKEKSRSTTRFKAIAEGENASMLTPKWLEKNENLLGGKVVALPQRDDIDYPVEEHLIVELYSK